MPWCGFGKACTSGRCGKFLRIDCVDSEGTEIAAQEQNVSSALVQLSSYSGEGRVHPAQRKLYEDHLNSVRAAQEWDSTGPGPSTGIEDAAQTT